MWTGRHLILRGTIDLHWNNEKKFQNDEFGVNFGEYIGINEY